MAAIRLGILGCAEIIHRAVFQPLAAVDGIEIAAIANRTRARAEQAAKRYGIAQIFDNLQDVVSSPDIDAIYIALSNELHAEWVIRAIEAGKHVLVEKPICLNRAEALRIRQAIQGREIHVLEGLMVQHHPWQQALCTLIREETYGRLIGLSTEIYVPFKGTGQEAISANYRCFPEKGGGAFYDLGCYWLQFLQNLLGLETENIECAQGHSYFQGPHGCDWTFEASVTYSFPASNSLRDSKYTGPENIRRVTASCCTSFEKPYRSRHVLETEHAILTINDFFRANLGRYKISIKVEDKQGRLLQILSFEPQHYYENQLRAFWDTVICLQDSSVIGCHREEVRGRSVRLLEEALQRAEWLESIRTSAVNATGISTLLER